MAGSEVSVALAHEHSAVLVADPAGDGFEVDADLDGVADEEVPEGVMCEVRELGVLAGGFERRSARGDGDDDQFAYDLVARQVVGGGKA